MPTIMLCNKFMIKASRVLIGLLLLLFLQNYSFAKENAYSFENLLEDGGLILDQPDEFEILSPQVNNVLSYEYSLRHKTKRVAVRYAIRPIKMIEIDYQDPHNSAPEPNHLYPMLFQSLISDFSRGGNSPSNEYSSNDARLKFNADWAGVAVMDVSRDFTVDYDQVLLLALHKNNESDAYVIVLFDDYGSVKPEINRLLKSLKFK